MGADDYYPAGTWGGDPSAPWNQPERDEAPERVHVVPGGGERMRRAYRETISECRKEATHADQVRRARGR